jgi:hypothetical protein
MKRFLLSLALIVGLSSTAFGQTAFLIPGSPALARGGVPIAGATIWFCTWNGVQPPAPCTTGTATVYLDPLQANPITQPAITDGLGNFSVFAASGMIAYTVSGSAVTTTTYGVTVGGTNGSFPPFQTNGTPNSSQTLLNIINGTPTTGITITATNTSGGNVQLGYSGTLTALGGGTGVTNFAFSGSTHTAVTLSGAATATDVPIFDASGNLIVGFPTKGTDANIPTSDSLAGATGTPVCKDANGGLSTVGCTQNGVVFSTPSGSVTGSIGATTMATAGGSGNVYRFSFYPTQTVLGASCGGNSTILVNLIWTDPNAAGPLTYPYSGDVATITTNGTLGPIFPGIAGMLTTVTFTAKSGTVVQYSTTYTPNGACSPNPAYQIYPILEQLK